jgi:hypothetical protein
VRPIGLWDVEDPTFSRQSAHRWQWDCQPYAPAVIYPPVRFLVLNSTRSWVDPTAIVRLEGLGELKNPMTSSRFEPATCRLVAQCLNQLTLPLAPHLKENYKISWNTFFLRIFSNISSSVNFNLRAKYWYQYVFLGLQLSLPCTEYDKQKTVEHVKTSSVFWDILPCSPLTCNGQHGVILSRDSVVGIATSYGLDDRGVGVRVPVGSRIFSSARRPDRLWGPPNLRGLFPRGKAGGAWGWPLTSS